VFKLLHAIWARLDLTNVGLLAIAVLWFALVSLCLWLERRILANAAVLLNHSRNDMAALSRIPVGVVRIGRSIVGLLRLFRTERRDGCRTIREVST
jgi:hypothetical protein